MGDEGRKKGERDGEEVKRAQGVGRTCGNRKRRMFGERGNGGKGRRKRREGRERSKRRIKLE